MMMMYKRLYFMLLCLLILCLAGNANATLYSNDFSTMGFTDGQNLEGTTLDYATFTSETTDLRYYSSYGAGIGTGYNWGGAGDTYINFSAPVANVSFRAGDGSGDLDAYAVTLYAYGTNALIGTWQTPQFGGSNEPEWYTLNITASNIGRIVFDPGNSGSLPGTKEGLGGIIITDFCYNSQPVPIPAAVWLLGSGLIGLIGIRRKVTK
jgi:hypothetical protein